MTDLLSGRIDLSGFRGLAAVGGFSYADVPESAKGWAATIRFNERLQAQFQDFTTGRTPSPWASATAASCLACSAGSPGTALRRNVSRVSF